MGEVGDRLTAIPKILQWGSALKIVDTVTWSGNNLNLISAEYTVNELVKVRFRWATENSNKLTCSFSSKRLDDHDVLKEGDGTTVKMDLRSGYLKYSEQGICPPECWSDWQLIAKVLACPIKNTSTYYAVCDLDISAYKTLMDTLTSKLYKDIDYTDFHLSTDEGSVPVHKACLATQSAVFKAMLSGEWQEVKEGKINLKGVTLQTLQHLKDYLYLGVVPDEGLRPLLLVARSYPIEDLADHCIRKLAQTATGTSTLSMNLLVRTTSRS